MIKNVSLDVVINTLRRINFNQRSYGVFLRETNLIYSEEHRKIQESLKKFIDTDINPYVDEWERQKSFPARHVFKQLGKGGFLGIDKPTEYGGMGLDYTYYIAMVEQLGAIRCGGVPMAVGVQSSLTTPALMRYGSDRLKQEFLAPTIAGELIACLGVSEPSAGSDVASIRTNAIIDGDDLVINGEKMWITNGMQADWMCLLANTEAIKDNKHLNKSLIALPMNLPGITRSKIEKMGMHCSDTAHIHFDNVRIPKNNVIGERGRGFVYQMQQFQEERLFSIAVALAPLETIIKETMEYASQRKLFEKPLLDKQVIQFTFGEMLTEVACLQSLLYRAVYSYVHEKTDVTLLASMGKLKVGRLSRQLMDKCLQFWGGMGYTPDVYVNRAYRDTRLISIGAGADEVMLDIISKLMMKAIR